MRPGLSARQEECLRLTAFRTDREIALLLGISEATVKKHVHEASQRLGVNRRKAALALLTAHPDQVASLPTTETIILADTSRQESGRFGYRPPPRDAYARLFLMAGLAVALAVTTTTVTLLVGDYHRLVDQRGPQLAFALPLAAVHGPAGAIR